MKEKPDIMDKIRSIFADYSDIINRYSEQVIDERYEFLYKEIEEFIQNFESINKQYEECLSINQFALIHAILDYYSDISRLKDFHAVSRANEYKILAYEAYWLLKRRPIQILKDQSEELVFMNEKFVLTYIVSFLCQNITPENSTSPYMNSFIDSFYYYLKYRVYTPQDIEMIILAFTVGASLSKSEQEEHE